MWGLPHREILSHEDVPSNENIFCITGHLCGEFMNSPHKGQWRGALMFSLICAWINGWVNNREAGDLRRHLDHYDINVMLYCWSFVRETTGHRCNHNDTFSSLRALCEGNPWVTSEVIVYSLLGTKLLSGLVYIGGTISETSVDFIGDNALTAI